MIALLKDNGRMANTELARHLGIAESTVRKRLKRLMDDGTIKVVAVGNIPMLLDGITGNINIFINKKKTRSVIQTLEKMDALWYVAQMAGPVDVDVEFKVASQAELGRLLDSINAIDGVVDTQTSIRLKLVKNRYDWNTTMSSGNIT